MRIAILGLCAYLSTAAAAQSETLGALKQRLGINADKAQISVSGISSGGWLAVQYHIAHSEQIVGAGILAGGPYHCAGSESFLCRYTPYAFLPHDSCQALYTCSRTAAKSSFLGFYIGPPNYLDSIDSTEREARKGTIDALSGLRGDRVWIFTGGRQDASPHDSLMPHDVVTELKKYYAALFAMPAIGNPLQNIEFVDTIQVEHAMVTDMPGSDECDRFKPPYINDCSYPAAENLLAFIYPQRPQIAASAPAGNPEAFDQGFASRDPRASMHAGGHIYVAQACRNGAQCPLHVALHGCDQDEESVGQLPASEQLYFHKDSGYNTWAEQHGAIILYPQAAKSRDNPHGCWDWWGYSGRDYYVKSSKQIVAINAMIECLTGDAACP